MPASVFSPGTRTFYKQASFIILPDCSQQLTVVHESKILKPNRFGKFRSQAFDYFY